MTKAPPLPPHFSHLTRAGAPLHLSTADAAELLEFWGFTRSGRDFLRKLERCAVLVPVPVTHQRTKRWDTAAVLAIYWRELK